MNGIVLVLLAAAAVRAAPAGELLPPSEVQRRSQVLIGQLGTLPVMGDDAALDRWSDALELEADLAPPLRWDDAAVLGRRALLTLDQELQASLAAATPTQGAPPAPSPPPASAPSPAAVAYDQIMADRPYAAGALPTLPAADAAAVQAGDRPGRCRRGGPRGQRRRRGGDRRRGARADPPGRHRPGAVGAQRAAAPRPRRRLPGAGHARPRRAVRSRAGDLVPQRPGRRGHRHRRPL